MKEITTVPLVHMNGTAKQDLLAERHDVLCHLRETYEALRNMTVNARDFYPQPVGSYEAAVELRIKRFKAIDDLIADIEAEWIAIDEQGNR